MKVKTEWRHTSTRADIQIWDCVGDNSPESEASMLVALASKLREEEGCLIAVLSVGFAESWELHLQAIVDLSVTE